MRGLVLGLASLGALLLAGCEKYDLNRQMEELCKKDGGVTVYENVKLPAERFDKNGNLVPIIPYREGLTFSDQLFGKEYVVEESTRVIKKGQPFDRFFSEGRLSRHVTQVRRVSDGKVLGERTWYARTGGEFTPFGMPSTTECPTPPQSILLLVFLKKD